MSHGVSRAVDIPTIPVIDLFAGPGGLGEGFSSLCDDRHRQVFRVKLSIEKEAHAHETLLLRAFFRQFLSSQVPEDYYRLLRGELSRETLFNNHKQAAANAAVEAWHAELGVTPDHEIKKRIGTALASAERWVLVGGPPCQAYSLAGRSRNRGNKEYLPEKDERHYLYRQYLRVLAQHRPPVFVMENVKGLLSATVSNQGLFVRMAEDLQAPRKALGLSEENPPLRYELHSVVPEAVGGKKEQLKNYLVESERHGVPQARHRLILLGVRSDLEKTPGRLPVSDTVSVSQWLSDLPPIRSGLSDRADSASAWLEYIKSAQDRRWYGSATSGNQRLRTKLEEIVGAIASPLHDRGARYIPWKRSSMAPEWVRDVALAGVCNHESRTHMAKDLHRYLFASALAAVEGRSPLLSDFPTDLLPDHANVTRGVEDKFFADRFRVQLADHPASTITSHIAKDGHYFIHHDPAQCRSLTVREAARLQTFPDNYYFCGARTSGYIQVGNAVPPLLAHHIARIVAGLLR